MTSDNNNNNLTDSENEIIIEGGENETDLEKSTEIIIDSSEDDSESTDEENENDNTDNQASETEHRSEKPITKVTPQQPDIAKFTPQQHNIAKVAPQQPNIAPQQLHKNEELAQQKRKELMEQTKPITSKSKTNVQTNHGNVSKIFIFTGFIVILCIAYLIMHLNIDVLFKNNMYKVYNSNKNNYINNRNSKVNINRFKESLITDKENYKQFFSGNDQLNYRMGANQFLRDYQQHYSSSLYQQAKLTKPLTFHISYPKQSRSEIKSFLREFYHQVFQNDQPDPSMYCHHELLVDFDNFHDFGRSIHRVNLNCQRALFFTDADEKSDLALLDSVFDGSLRLDPKDPHSFTLNHTYVVLSSIGQDELYEYSQEHQQSDSFDYIDLVSLLIQETKKYWQHRFCTRITSMIPFTKVNTN